MNDKPEEQPVDVSKRRHFLKSVATATGTIPFTHGVLAAGAVAATLPAQAQTAPATAPAADPTVGYVCFSRDEAAFVETMVNVMCPADEFTPNGVDCGLPIYIDRQLAGDFGRGLKRYARGPWMQGKPQQGYQLPMTPEQYFKAGIEAANTACIAKYGKAFDRITPAQGDAFLTDLSTGKFPDAKPPLQAWFNDLIYPLFQQACFADPIYGGNYNKVFWKMIGYPGLPATNTINMVQYRGKPYPGSADPKSIADFS
jgi:gluconate 2-dehydrogenase gamma chain